VSSVGSFFSYINDARSHEPEVLRILIFAYKIRNPYNFKAYFQSYSTLHARTSLIRYVNNELMGRQTLYTLHSLYNCSGCRTACFSTDDRCLSRAAKYSERDTDHVHIYSLPISYVYIALFAPYLEMLVFRAVVWARNNVMLREG